MYTGLMIQDTPRAGFPPYYAPKLNGLVFAVCSQLVVEWSAWLQWVVSRKFFLMLFPHIFTIYLFHGFIFWSVGAWICIQLAAAGLPYWANMLCTAIVSYTVLFCSLPIVTPVVEALGKTLTANIWQSASEKPVPKRPSLFPFPADLFSSRGQNFAESETSADEESLKRGKDEKVSAQGPAL